MVGSVKREWLTTVVLNIEPCINTSTGSSVTHTGNSGTVAPVCQMTVHSAPKPSSHGRSLALLLLFAE